ncbi:hypothetical protein BSSX_2681 [Bacillus subtilis]|nr:hypothetical protein BSSX_2681 [Bacillus subtilis]
MDYCRSKEKVEIPFYGEMNHIKDRKAFLKKLCGLWVSFLLCISL